MTAALSVRTVTPAASARCDADRLASALTIALTCFFLFRPALDVIVTFDLGPNLNLPIGGLLLLTLAGWLAHQLRTDTHIVVPAVSMAALALGTSSVLSALGAENLVFAGSLALRLVTAALIFIACEQLAFRDERAATPMVTAIAVGLGTTAFVAIGQLAKWFPRPAGDGLDDTRIPGPFPAPTVFATCMFVVVAVIVGLAPLWWRRQPNLIWVLLPVAAACSYLMLANGSRSPLGALFIAVVIIAIAQRRWMLLAPFVVAAAVVTMFNPSILERPLEVFDTSDDFVVVGAETNTLIFRLRYWERNLPLVEESPVVGLGLGAVELLNGEDFPPHSTTVQAYIEMGIVGLIAHYVLVFALAGALIGAVRRAQSLRVRCYVSVAFGLSVGYFAMSFFENLLTQVVTTGPIAAIVGLALGLERHERRQLAGPNAQRAVTA